MAGMDMDRALRHLGAESFEDIFYLKIPGIRRLFIGLASTTLGTDIRASMSIESYLHIHPAQKRLLQHVMNASAAGGLSLSNSHRVLLIWGRHDRLFPVHIGQRAQAHIGDRRPSCHRGLCTLPKFEQAHEWNLAVTRFLSHQEYEHLRVSPQHLRLDGGTLSEYRRFERGPIGSISIVQYVRRAQHFADNLACRHRPDRSGIALT